MGRDEESVAYQIIVSTLHRKIWKAHIKTINPMINSGLFWDIQDYFEYIITKHKTLTNNLQIKICINKIKNRITFKFKTEHQLELLKPELTKLLENTKKKVSKHKYDRNLSHLEITEVTVVHYNIANNDYQQNS